MPSLDAPVFFRFNLGLVRILLMTATFALAVFGQGKQPPKPPAGAGGGIGGSQPMPVNLVISICDETGALLNEMAMVKLKTESGSIGATTMAHSGRAEFYDVRGELYTIQVEAEGYEPLEERIPFLLGRGQIEHRVMLTHKGVLGAPRVQDGPPLLAPKAQKELSQGLQGLRNGKPDEARKHLAAAARLAPNHPDVNYLLGVLESQVGNASGAQVYWKKAVSESPKHTFALAALGGSALTAGDLPLAREQLERAIKADSNFWRAHYLLAVVLLKQGNYSDSVREAEKALEVGKSKANESRLVLARALAAQNDRAGAIKALQELLAADPTEQQSQAAQQALNALRSPPPGPDASSPGSTGVALASTEQTEDSKVAAAVRTAVELPKWIPEDVDDSVPPVDSGAACPLEQIMEQTGKRAVEFTHAVDRFTATETLEHEYVNKWGLTSRSERRKFSYVVSISEVRPGILNVEEYRNGPDLTAGFPDGIATLGMVSLLLAFHPVYVNDYDLKCEGLSHQRGQDAWQVHFRQKPERPSRLLSFRLSNNYVPVPLKGRAWISADTFHVLRMETDLVAQVPDIRLLAEHQTINYGPVPFHKKNVTLWLPFDTDLYIDYKGHRMHRRHSFSDFLLFSVDDRQQIQSPEEPATSTKSSGF